MKKNIRILIYPLIMVMFLMLSSSCSKTDTNDPTPSGTVTDIDGNVYKTVTIGTQVWMAENLKTTKYRNGDSIRTTVPATLNIENDTVSKYQWIHIDDGPEPAMTIKHESYAANDSMVDENEKVYGRLYTWYAANDSRGVC